MLEMKEEQELFIENPENEANVFMATMDLKDRILLCAGAGAEPESHRMEGDADEIVVRSPPFEAQPDDIPS